MGCSTSVVADKAALNMKPSNHAEEKPVEQTINYPAVLIQMRGSKQETHSKKLIPHSDLIVPPRNIPLGFYDIPSDKRWPENILHDLKVYRQSQLHPLIVRPKVVAFSQTIYSITEECLIQTENLNVCWKCKGLLHTRLDTHLTTRDITSIGSRDYLYYERASPQIIHVETTDTSQSVGSENQLFQNDSKVCIFEATTASCRSLLGSLPAVNRLDRTNLMPPTETREHLSASTSGLNEAQSQVHVDVSYADIYGIDVNTACQVSNSCVGTFDSGYMSLESPSDVKRRRHSSSMQGSAVSSVASTPRHNGPALTAVSPQRSMKEKLANPLVTVELARLRTQDENENADMFAFENSGSRPVRARLLELVRS
eukprot:Colp12_sorted_trinity150504_noHs@8195